VKKKKTAVITENPKTSIGGAIAVAAMIASLWLPAEQQTKVQTSIGILAGSGLIVAAADPSKKGK
jgi:hypothetical protein